MERYRVPQEYKEKSFLGRTLTSKWSKRFFGAWSILTLILVPLFYYQAFFNLDYPLTIEWLVLIPLLAVFAGISLIVCTAPMIFIIYLFDKIPGEGGCDGCE